MKRFLLFSFGLVAAGLLYAENPLLLHYDFNTINGKVLNECDSSNVASLENKAMISNIGPYRVLNLGEENGYLDMGTEIGTQIIALEDFSVATYYYIDESASIDGDGYFLWAFSTSPSCSQYSGKYVAYRVNAQRYALSTGGWSNEVVGIQRGSNSRKGSWVHLVYTQKGSVGTIYRNGEVYVTGTATQQPKVLSTATTCNWLGRSPFSGDAYLKKTMLSDFRIYEVALSAEEVTDLSLSRLDSLNYWMEFYRMDQLFADLTLPDTTDIIQDLELPTSVGGIAISWTSSMPEVISTAGKVTRPQGDTAKVVLTATLSKGEILKQKSFHVTVLPYFDDATSVQRDMTAIVFKTNQELILKYDLLLPDQGMEGSRYTWHSSDEVYFSNEGKIRQRPAVGEKDKQLTLRLVVSKGTACDSVSYPMVIPADLSYYAYLFAYFTGNSVSQEAIRFALSFDGFNYKALNGNQPIISSDTISEMGGVRDPHIMRCANDNCFYMVVTDMRSSLGWSSNHGMVLLKSTDLVHWQHTAIDVADVFTEFKDINRAWAPQTIYDQQTGKYMLYWSMRAGSDIDVIHYAYVNDDFTAITSLPQVLFDNPAGTACIDGDIVYKDGKYYMFYKTEGSGNGIKKVVADLAYGPYRVESDKTLQSTSQAVEGSCVFKLYDSDTYVLMYDLYTSGKYQFTRTTDLDNFSIVNNTSMDFAPRHGTVIPITKDETRRLIAQWGEGFDPIPEDSIPVDTVVVNPIPNDTIPVDTVVVNPIPNDTIPVDTVVVNPIPDDTIPQGLLASEAFELRTWPSPADDFLFISSSFRKPLSVDVYGLSGKCVIKSQPYTDSGINCSTLASGCYFIKADDGQNVWHTCFVKR